MQRPRFAGSDIIVGLCGSAYKAIFIIPIVFCHVCDLSPLTCPPLFNHYLILLQESSVDPEPTISSTLSGASADSRSENPHPNPRCNDSCPNSHSVMNYRYNEMGPNLGLTLGSLHR